MEFKLVSYAMDFASFLIEEIKDKEKIRNIILFGSVSRGDNDNNSDIDIFIDIVREDKKIEKEISRILMKFKDSVKFKNYWKLLGVENETKIMVGNLDNWKGLKSSIIANGILFYGKFKPFVEEGKHLVLFVWENIKPNSKRVLFNKQMFGYKQKGKFYEGLIGKYGAERFGKGCIIAPLEQSNIFHSLFKKYRIGVKIKKVLEY